MSKEEIHKMEVEALQNDIEARQEQLDAFLKDRKRLESTTVTLNDIINSLKSELLQVYRAKDKLKVKADRYDNLKDRYLNQNEKHFGELCGLYFEDEE